MSQYWSWQQSVSIIQLIANPNEFDGKNISLGGYLEIRDENENSLFLDENARRHGMSANSIAIDFETASPALKKRAQELNHTYVFVSGRYKGETTIFSRGKLSDVYYIAPAPSSESTP